MSSDSELTEPCPQCNGSGKWEFRGHVFDCSYCPNYSGRVPAACRWCGGYGWTAEADPRTDEIEESGWGTVDGVFMCRPPGTPRALPLGAHTVTFDDEGRPTVNPSVFYDPGGPHEWHGWLIAGEWTL